MKTYPLDEKRLFGIDKGGRTLRFTKGVPSYKYRFGYAHNPAYICWWALLNLNEYHRTKDKQELNAFLLQADWLVKNAKDRCGGKAWTYEFDWKEGKAILKKPWISAMSQGLAMSVLSRAYMLTKKRRYLDTAKKAMAPFEQGVDEGGVMTREEGLIFYEEYPAYPLARVLDGEIFSLIGLYDLYSIGKDKKAGVLFKKGADSLSKSLHRWDWRGKWSWYGTRGVLSTPHYNRLNSKLLAIMHEITGNERFQRYSRAWDESRKNAAERAICRAAQLASAGKLIARTRLCAE